mgnify:CR=1 FL=1
MGILVPFLIVAVAAALIASYYKKKQKQTCCTDCCGALGFLSWKKHSQKATVDPQGDEEELLKKQKAEKKELDAKQAAKNQIDEIMKGVQRFMKNSKGDLEINEKMINDIV